MTSPNKKKEQIHMLKKVFAIFGLLYFLSVFLNIYNIIEYKLIDDWEQVDATITKFHNYKFNYTIDYNYEINGNRYSSNRISIMDYDGHSSAISEIRNKYTVIP